MIQNMDKKKILVIEDDTSLRKAIVEHLTLNGFEALGAENGQEGLRLALELKPDLVLLDLLMPVMDGVTALKGLRLNFGKELPVIILTNVDPSDQTINDVLKYQASYYLVKSALELDKLVEHIRSTLKLDGSPTVS